MTLIQFLLTVLLITLSFASNSEINFSEITKDIIIEESNLQPYTNDLEEDATMRLTLILDSGREYNIENVPCRKGKGQFTWFVPNSIPENSVGHFEYTVFTDDGEITGSTGKVKFFYSSSSSSSNNNSSSSSTSSTSSSDSNSSSSSSSSSSSTSSAESSGKDSSSSLSASSTTTSQKAPNEASNLSPDKIILSTNSTNIQNGNDTVADAQGQESPVNNSPQQLINDESSQTTENSFNSENKASEGVNGNVNGNDENSKYLMYIGGGSGIVFVALTGLFIAYKVKSKRSLSNYEFDSRPYNNTSMDNSQVPNLLNGNLAPVNILGSPSFNDVPSKGGNYGLYNNNNNPKSYRVPGNDNGNSGLLLSPAFSNLSGNMNNTSFYNSPNVNKDKSKRNTYEMISPYDPRETSYQNFTGNFEDSLVLDNNGIINLNSNQNMNLNVDINKKLPKSENYCANPRSGSLPRNRVPNDIAVPLMTDEDNEESKKNYRSSILSYISSNRGSYYGGVAEHSISHILLNQVCTVAYASQPENEDELYLCVGDKVKILEVYDDGWAYSLHISSGLEGMIPLNCTAEYYQ